MKIGIARKRQSLVMIDRTIILPEYRNGGFLLFTELRKIGCEAIHKISISHGFFLGAPRELESFPLIL